MTNAPTPAARVSFALRAAEPRDVGDIVRLIRELAEFEKLAHLVAATPEALRPHLFGERPVVEALVAEAVAVAGEQDNSDEKTVVAFAPFFTNFSTFLAKPGLYLEDLYVQPEHRGAGIGEALLTRLAQLAVERGCGRFEWSVLDWNENAIGFYQKMGATLMHDWRICRVAGAALQRLGAP